MGSTTRVTDPLTHEWYRKELQDDLEFYCDTGDFAVSGFEPLQLLSIKCYENELHSKAQKFWKTDDSKWSWTLNVANFEAGGLSHFEDELAEIRKLLASYCQAIRDLQEMSSRSRHDARSRTWGGFWDSGLYNPSGWLRSVQDPHTNNFIINLAMSFMWIAGALLDRQNPIVRRLKSGKDRIKRFLFAITGGAALLVPMIIMTYKTSQHARLTVVSIAVVLFSLFMASTSASKENLVAATAAYAAVLVVYIGSASPTPNAGG